MMNKRFPRAVCLTGIGVITPFCNGWGEVFKTVSTASPTYAPWNPNNDPPCDTARLGLVKNYPKEHYFNDRQLRLMDRAMTISSTAVGLALEDAHFSMEGQSGTGDEVASIMGSMRGEMPSLYKFGVPLFRNANSVLNPAQFPMIARNISCGQAAIRFGLRGWSTMIAAGEISGAHALARARDLIASGRSRAAVVGAYEVFSPISLHHIRLRSKKYNREHLFSTENVNDHVPVEGACFFILEDLEHALSERRIPYAILNSLTHGYLNNASVDAFSAISTRHLAKNNTEPEGLDFLISGIANSNGSEFTSEKMLVRELTERCDQPIELRTRPIFGDAGSLSFMFQIAMAAQLLRSNDIDPLLLSRISTPSDQLIVKKKLDEMSYKTAIATAVTDRGAYCLSSLSRVHDSTSIKKSGALLN